MLVGDKADGLPPGRICVCTPTERLVTESSGSRREPRMTNLINKLMIFKNQSHLDCIDLFT